MYDFKEKLCDKCKSPDIELDIGSDAAEDYITWKCSRCHHIEICPQRRINNENQ